MENNFEKHSIQDVARLAEYASAIVKNAKDDISRNLAAVLLKRLVDEYNLRVTVAHQ